MTYQKLDRKIDFQLSFGVKNMMKKGLIVLGLFFLGLLEPAYAARVQGPLMTPLEIQQMYLTEGGSVYVGFQDGAMPNCYSNRGGLLFKSHPNFDEIYAQLLMIVATNGIRAHVLFDTVNPNVGQWSDCNIAGIFLRPLQ